MTVALAYTVGRRRRKHHDEPAKPGMLRRHATARAAKAGRSRS